MKRAFSKKLVLSFILFMLLCTVGLLLLFPGRSRHTVKPDDTDLTPAQMWNLSQLQKNFRIPQNPLFPRKIDWIDSYIIHTGYDKDAEWQYLFSSSFREAHRSDSQE